MNRLDKIRELVGLYDQLLLLWFLFRTNAALLHKFVLLNNSTIRGSYACVQAVLEPTECHFCSGLLR